MKFKEYHELLKKYKMAESSYYKALDKKSKLLYNVEPHSVRIKEILVDSSFDRPDSMIIDYTVEIDKVNELINNARNNKDVLGYELKKKEEQLRCSNNVYDRIYVFQWIEHKRVVEYYRLLNYSKRQIYNLIKEIKQKIYVN